MALKTAAARTGNKRKMTPTCPLSPLRAAWQPVEVRGMEKQIERIHVTYCNVTSIKNMEVTSLSPCNTLGNLRVLVESITLTCSCHLHVHARSDVTALLCHLFLLHFSPPLKQVMMGTQVLLAPLAMMVWV